MYSSNSKSKIRIKNMNGDINLQWFVMFILITTNHFPPETHEL